MTQIKIWLRIVLLVTGGFFLYVLWEREERKKHEKWLEEHRELLDWYANRPKIDAHQEAMDSLDQIKVMVGLPELAQNRAQAEFSLMLQRQERKKKNEH